MELHDDLHALGYLLVFPSLFNRGRALAFPCDRDGSVDVHALPGPARSNYFHASRSIGRDYACPRIVGTAELRRHRQAVL
jgi:hypothetical protein